MVLIMDKLVIVFAVASDEVANQLLGSLRVNAIYSSSSLKALSNGK